MIARKELSEPSMEIVFGSSRDKKAKTPWRLLGLASLGLVLVGLYGWDELSHTAVVEPVSTGEVSLLAGSEMVFPALYLQEEELSIDSSGEEKEVLSWILTAQKIEKSDPSHAADLYSRVVEFQPDRVQIWKTIGHLRLQSGEEGLAKQAYQAYLHEFPRDVSVLGLMAELEIRSGREEEASRLLGRALQESPSAGLWFLLGNCHLARGKEPEAIKAYRETIQLDSKHAEARYHLAHLLEENGQVREAITILEGGGRALFRHHQDRLVAQTGGLPAEQVFQRISLSTDALQLATVASGFHSSGAFEEAKALLDRAVTFRPDAIDLRHNRGTLAFELGEWEVAREEYLAVLKMDPTHGETHFNMGILHEREERLEKALASYEATLQCIPNHTGAMNNIGALYLRVGRPAPARMLFSKILTKDPAYAHAYVNIAWADLMEGREEEALTSLRKYVSLVSPDQVEPEVVGKISLLEKKVLEKE